MYITNGEVWYTGDDLEGGAKFLRGLGRSPMDYMTVSAGYSAEWEPQVLVLGHGHVEILNHSGAQILDAGEREVRAVRRMEGSGVQVCLCSKVENGEFRPTRWLHRVSEAGARYLEQCWLDAHRIVHSGVQLNPLHWREEEYAHYVGRVVTEAAKCDTALVALVLSAQKLLGRDSPVFGASGSQLADELDKLGKLSPALADLGERYRAWYDKRNFVTHGMRVHDYTGRASGRVIKAQKVRKRDLSEAGFKAEDQDFQDLALIWRAFYALHHDAFRAGFHLYGPGTPEEVLARLPFPNTVSASERLPKEPDGRYPT